MDTKHPPSFGPLLRRYRIAAGLSQEALAERAQLSWRGISDLERGVNSTPRAETLERLLDALQLPAADRATLEATIQRRRGPPAPAATRTPGILELENAPPPAPGTNLPAGVVTFLFTDVEGSTALWERHEPLMRTAIARHDALLDACIARYGGRRVKDRGEGDSLFAVFPQPDDAVLAALAMVGALLAEPWPSETPIRVRMGMHTGSVQPREADYYGPAVNRTARIRGLGHGGQILLSATTASLVQSSLPPAVTLRSLGAQPLQGMDQPEEIFQLCHPDLPADFPPLPAPQAARHNLPQSLTGLIGREAERQEVLGLLEGARLVTLTGAGGVGKTRLAIKVAGTLLADCPNGVWLVELAPLRDPALVPGAIAQVLGMRETDGWSSQGDLIAYLRTRHMLLVLDNFEHLLPAAPLLAELVAACPQLRLLVTSRAALNLRGEQEYNVPPLRLPSATQPFSPEMLAQVAAVQLFVERVRAVRPSFALSSENAVAVAAICERLDGLPLAIELAAARVKLLPPGALLRRLERRLPMLSAGAQDAPERQRTMRGAIAWSYDLLRAHEQALFRRLAVFAGGCTIEAVESVCRVGGDLEGDVLDWLGSLQDKSLLTQRGEDEAEPRFTMLETMREFGLEQLETAGEAAAIRDRHLAWCAALAERAEAARATAEQKEWVVRLELEHDNLRAALAWSLASTGDVLTGLRLAIALGWFWLLRGHLHEGCGWLQTAVTRAAPAPAALRARALGLLGTLATTQGDSLRAAAALEESLRLYQELGDRPSVAASFTRLGLLILSQGDQERARALLEESLAIHRELQDDERLANVLINLGAVRNALGDHLGAAAALEESLALLERLGDQSGIAVALHNLGEAAMASGDYASAQARFERSLALFDGLGHKRGVAATLRCLSSVAAHLGRHRQATQLLAAADVLREQLGIPPEKEERQQHEEVVRLVRQALGDEGFEHAWRTGREMPAEEAVAAGLGVATR